MIQTPDGRPVFPFGRDGAGVTLTAEGQQDARLRDAMLDEAEVRHYRAIFELQERGDWDSADAEIRALTDKRLLGHVLRQRYLHPDRKASWEELAEWMRLYADHGGAERIHALALRRQPAGVKPPRRPRGPDDESRPSGDLERFAGYRPSSPTQSASADEADVDETAADAVSEDDAIRVAPRSRSSRRDSGGSDAVAQVTELLRAGKPEEALGLLGREDVGGRLDPVQYDSSRSRIAAGLLYSGQVADALATASASAARSGAVVTKAHWVAGLAAFRLQQYERAARHFEALVAARPASPWVAAGAAFWAARSLEAKGREEEARGYLAAAALFPHTFYGLLAERKLGQPTRLRWSLPALTPERLAALAERPDGRRGIALIQVGQYEAAELELSHINPGGKPLVEEALLTLADRGGMASLALELGNAMLSPEGAPYDAALFPLPYWRPRDGFSVDRALLFAVMRQESRFEPRLTSPAGAVGLMQIMPATAQHVRERNADIDDADRAALFDPATNMELSQRYLAELMGMPEIGRNMILTLAAYNAGPGNLMRWRRTMAEIKDPLLFIESIPFAETRGYVKKVLANFWAYRFRLGQETASLDAVAGGDWPVYMAVDARPTQVALTAASPADAAVADNADTEAEERLDP